MSNSHSPRSFRYDHDADFPGERHSDQFPTAVPFTPPPQGTYPLPQVPRQPAQAQKTQQPAISGPIHDVQTTQSLISALQATMTPTSAIKRPVVIPGAKKHTTNTTGMQRLQRVQRIPGAQNRRSPNTESLPRSTSGLSPRLRLLIVLIVIIVILLISLFSLTPLGGGQRGQPFLGGVIQWAQNQQQNLSMAIGHMTTTNQGQNNAPAAPAANPPAMTLPKSQYVAIAQQAATSAGIPATYFVRQINQESGFNPNAVSPSGAVGIAQFLPSTAAGLGINPYDPVQALNGAARYMARLYNQYGGDYAKALAAYNAGSGTVQNAINRGGANWMNFLPAETRNYIRVIMGI